MLLRCLHSVHQFALNSNQLDQRPSQSLVIHLTGHSSFEADLLTILWQFQVRPNPFIHHLKPHLVKLLMAPFQLSAHKS